MVGPSEISERLTGVHRRIEHAGGDLQRVAVLPVTKGFGVDVVVAAMEAGCTEVGENYAQELSAKAAALAATPRSDGRSVQWHFLGAVQRNKVKGLAPLVACWQGVARAVEGAAIARHSPGARVMVEVETTGDPGRNGCPPGDVPALVRSLEGLGLAVTGLMTVAPAEAERARTCFRTVRELADRLGLPDRSMGMTDDLELAVAEGSTMVRVGRALFGERASRQGMIHESPHRGTTL